MRGIRAGSDGTRPEHPRSRLGRGMTPDTQDPAGSCIKPAASRITQVIAQLPFTPLKGKPEGKLQSAAGERRKTRLLVKVLLEVWLSAQGAPAPSRRLRTPARPLLGLAAGRASCRAVLLKARGVMWSERTAALLPTLH